MGSQPILLNRLWTNHSVNAFSGWTTTVTSLTSAIIVAALAILVGWTGEAVWTITAFLLHQYRTTRDPETALFRHFQLLLCNRNSSFMTSYEILRIGFKWRGKVNHAVTKALTLAFWPLLIFTGFSAAGILVAKATIPADDVNLVLLQPSNCGLWYSNDTLNWNQQTIHTYIELNKKHYADAQHSRDYASDCYNDIAQPLRLRPGAKGATPLPQSSTLARWTHIKRLVSMLGRDTEFLSACEPKCAVLDLDDRLLRMLHPQFPNDFEVLRKFLGPRANDNYTFEYSTMDYYDNCTYGLDAVKYMAAPCSSPSHNCLDNNWLPLPGLRFQDAFLDSDVTIIQQANNAVAYREPILDPFFYAGFQAMRGMSISSRWVYHMGCFDQLQICNPVTDRCSPLTGAQKLSTDELNLNPKQEATADRIKKARVFSTIYDAVHHHDRPPLLVDYMRSNFVSVSFPDDQWTEGIERWFQTTLANMQLRTNDSADNFWNKDPSKAPRPVPAHDWPPATQAMVELCNQQLVRPTEQYQSFSLAGIIIVVVLSLAIIILASTLEKCLSSRSNRKLGGSKRYKLLAYSADGKLQLLRTSLEAIGVDGWRNKTGHVPYRYSKNPWNEKDIAPAFEEKEIPPQHVQNKAHEGEREHDRHKGYPFFDPHHPGRNGLQFGAMRNTEYGHVPPSAHSESIPVSDRIPLVRQQYAENRW